MSDLGYDEGIANQNAMTSAAIRTNAMSQDIQKRTIDELKRNLKTNLTTLNQQGKNDEVVSGSKDLYSLGTDVGQFYTMGSEISKAGGFKAYLRGAGAGDRLATIGGGFTKGLTGAGSGISNLRNDFAESTLGKSIRGGTGTVVRPSVMGGGTRTVETLESGALRSQNANLPLTTPADRTTVGSLSSQVQNAAGEEARSTLSTNNPSSEGAEPTTLNEEPTVAPRSSVAGSGAEAVENVPVSESDKLTQRLNEGLDQVNETTSKLGKLNNIAGTAMGITAGVEDIMKISDGDYKKMNGWNKVSDVTGIISGGLDAVSVALPFLAPLGGLFSGISAVSGTVGDLEGVAAQKKADKTGEASDETDAKSQAASQVVSPILATQGLIASRSMDNTALIGPSGGF